MIDRRFRLGTLFSGFAFAAGALATPLLCSAASPSAPPAGFSVDASKSARLLRQDTRQLHPVYGAPSARQLSAGSLALSQPNHAISAVYEFSARIDGRVSSGGEEMLMLRVGNGNSVSLDAMLPSGFFAPWLTSGSQVRLIARTISGVQSDNDLSARADCVVLAAAPESEMLLLERQALTTYAVRPFELTQAEPSRSEPYSRAAESISSANVAPGHPICSLSVPALAAYPLYRDQIHRLNRRLDDQTLDKITSSILGYSDRYRIDPRLIMAMMIAESHFDPNSVSRTGAIGLGQLMPGTAAGLGVDPWDLERSIGASVKILSDHVAQYGGADSQGLVPINTLLLTMAAYNAGGGAVRRYHGVPPYRETQTYVRRVASYYRQLCGT